MDFIKKLKNLRRPLKNEYKNHTLLWFLGEIVATRFNKFPAISSGYYIFYKHFFDSVKDADKYITVDVGANDGLSALIFYRFNPKLQVISYEPLKSQEESLKKLKTRFSRFKYILKAVGKKTGRLTIREFEDSGLSSIKSLEKDAYPKGMGTKLINSYKVDVVTLDQEFVNTSKKLIVKIDTQGFEMEVLQGATKLMQKGRIKYIIVELANSAHYKNQTTYWEIIEFLQKKGFVLFDLNPFLYNLDGSLSEFDAIFYLP